jgi:hypothetical protein
MCSCVTSDKGKPNSTMVQKGRRDNACKLSNSLLFLDLFLYLSFLFRRREGGREMMGDCARGHRLCVGATTSYITPRCNS